MFRMFGGERGRFKFFVKFPFSFVFWCPSFDRFDKNEYLKILEEYKKELEEELKEVEKR